MGFSSRLRGLWKCLLCFQVLLSVLYFTSPSLRGLAIFFLLPMDKCQLESAQDLLQDNRVDAELDLVYLDAYLPSFLNSSERHFMLGLPVTYYVFTDTPEKVPDMKLPPLRSLVLIKVKKHSRWQDISMMRMKIISDVIETDIRHRCTHVFCFDVDQVFTGRFGSEALGNSVALLHAYFYRLPKSMYTYDRNPRSKAYMKTGDFYYHAAIFGGLCESVKAIADACYQGIMEDKENNVEALWHDESHLNKYLWLHKPSRVLSPEYCWDPLYGKDSNIKVTRLEWAPKRYKELRNV